VVYGNNEIIRFIIYLIFAYCLMVISDDHSALNSKDISNYLQCVKRVYYVLLKKVFPTREIMIIMIRRDESLRRFQAAVTFEGR